MAIKQKQKFMRSDFRKFSKLGLRRKKKQVYRRSKGIDNKIRLKTKGHLRNISIGFRKEKVARAKINNLTPILIYNLKELKLLKKNEIAIIANVGNKNKREILSYCIKNNIPTLHNSKKLLEKIEEKHKKLKENKENRNKKKIEKDKKAKKEADKKEKDDKEKEEKAKKEADKKDEDKNNEETKENDDKVKKQETKPLPKPKQSKDTIKSNNYGRGN